VRKEAKPQKRVQDNRFRIQKPIAAGFITACVSVPKHHNLTGTWKYTFEETGKSEVHD